MGHAPYRGVGEECRKDGVFSDTAEVDHGMEASIWSNAVKDIIRLKPSMHESHIDRS